MLTEEQLERYRGCYCGLCRSLQERHGELSRLTLNYDMTFLVLLLGSLYEPEERGGERAVAGFERQAPAAAAGSCLQYILHVVVSLFFIPH